MKTPNDNRVWMITGASRGFGRELARVALKRGDSVIATSRNPRKVADFSKQASDRLLAIPMDLRDPARISSAVEAGIGRFGRIDALVNNAGHGSIGAVEEATAKLDSLRKDFESWRKVTLSSDFPAPGGAGAKIPSHN